MVLRRNVLGRVNSTKEDGQLSRLRVTIPPKTLEHLVHHKSLNPLSGSIIALLVLSPWYAYSLKQSLIVKQMTLPCEGGDESVFIFASTSRWFSCFAWDVFLISSFCSSLE